MIKTVSLLTRKPEISHEEFVRHWVEVHAPLAHGIPGLRRYVLSLITEEAGARHDIPMQAMEVDGIAELWYDDIDTWRRAASTPEAKRLHADGALFIGRIRTFVTEENVIIPKS